MGRWALTSLHLNFAPLNLLRSRFDQEIDVSPLNPAALT